ncbi:MAG TPA: hypothetical protein VGM10_05760 [Actinocrinis sp.]|jgi:hypothetical protein
MNSRAFIGMSASTLYAIAIVASALYFHHAVAGVALIGAMVVGAAWSLPGVAFRRKSTAAQRVEMPQDATSKTFE